MLEHEILRALVSVIDIAGLYLLFNAKKLVNVMGDIEVKLVSIGLGWAAAELLTTHFVNIIFQSWSIEMKTEYIVNAIFANFDLLDILSLATLAYTLTKKGSSGKKIFVLMLVLSRYIFPVVLKHA